MTDSTNLALPYLEGAQAQKHVTVNESLRKLDALVLLAVEDKDLTAPPGSPADGARYIPKATATGAWSGKENTVAHYVDGAWEFYTPREGFAAYVRDEDRAYVYDGSAWQRADRAAHANVSADTTLDLTHIGRTVLVDASGGARTITLPTSPSADDWVAVKKSDSSANRVTVKVGSTDMAWLSAQNDGALFAYWGGAWVAVRWNIAPVRDVFTASGTWTKAPLAQFVESVCIGAGGGGGSGRRGNTGNNKGGGVGGQSGVLNRWSFRAAALSATETVTVGAAGTGGTAISSGSSSGNAGTAGGSSSFGAHLVAPGGAAGAGGINSNSASGNVAATLGGAVAQAQAAANVTSDSGAVLDGAGPGTGGSGGGSNTADAVFAASAGGKGSSASASPLAGGAAGGTGAAGSDGASIGDTVNQFGGSGGGGGGASAAGSAGAGGAGGTPGGGGGGGGSCINSGGNVSGAGGAGARGEVRVVTYF